MTARTSNRPQFGTRSNGNGGQPYECSLEAEAPGREDTAFQEGDRIGLWTKSDARRTLTTLKIEPAGVARVG